MDLIWNLEKFKEYYPLRFRVIKENIAGADATISAFQEREPGPVSWELICDGLVSPPEKKDPYPPHTKGTSSEISAGFKGSKAR